MPDSHQATDRRDAQGEASALAPMPGSRALVMQLLQGDLRTPHDVLGAHSTELDGVSGVVIRARVPRAVRLWVIAGDDRIPMERRDDAFFVCFLPGVSLPMVYRIAAELIDGDTREFDDPYRFLPTIGDVDLHLYGEGRHLRLWEKLGAHPRVIEGVAGTSFAVWAPTARRVSVIGSFNDWDGRAHVMRVLGASGVFELFIPGVAVGDLYKFEIRTAAGATRVKTDPLGFRMEQSPGHASVVEQRGTHHWMDTEWMARRVHAQPLGEPMLVYEVHLGSWRRNASGQFLNYRELAPLLADHVAHLGFTHVELLPVLEHPYGGSWGYQVSGYYAPTSRHGTPDDFRFFVDTLHQAGIGVLLDWVPAHFPKDDWALRRFDGTACYEHEDPRLGDHPEWGTHIFNYARHEVRNYLLANALFWIEEFHLDGLRVDAVASMLYLDYGREAGQWLRNRKGGRENLEAEAFLKQLNHAVHSLHPGVMTIAEESTTWPRVTHAIADGGLGFTFKWNMGWMHDTLDYFKVDPFFRKGAHDKLTFAMMYEYSERFVNPLSHDEVVHMKGSLLRKMPGDEWQRLANLRTLIGYSITRPGKSVFFMGTELGPWSEWNHDASLEWQLLDDLRRRGLLAFVSEAGAVYREQSCLWRHDHDASGFQWIDVNDKEQSVLSFARFDGAAHAIIVMNLTPVPRDHYRLGAPASGGYRIALNSDAQAFGGSGYAVAESLTADGEPYHGFPQSLLVTLPPLSILVLVPDSIPHVAVEIDAAEALDQNLDAVFQSVVPTRPAADVTPTKRRRTAVLKRTGVVRDVESPREVPLAARAGASPSSVDRARAKMAERSTKAKSAKAAKAGLSTTTESSKSKHDKPKLKKAKTRKTKSDAAPRDE